MMVHSLLEPLWFIHYLNHDGLDDLVTVTGMITTLITVPEGKEDWKIVSFNQRNTGIFSR